MVKIYSIYDKPEVPGVTFTEPSLSQQHFKDECDINNIMAKYAKTGVWGDPNNPSTTQPMFDDFSTAEDFHSAQNFLAQAGQAFEALPAYLRKRFENDPAELLAFLDDESNREEAERLGLVQKTIVNDLTNPRIELHTDDSGKIVNPE